MDLCEARSNGVGARHPWELARLAHVRVVLETVLGARSRLLDVGSGDSFVAASVLAAHPQIQEASCVDVNYSPQDLLAEIGDGRLRRTTAINGKGYDVLLLLDVLEHVEDSGGLLRTLGDSVASESAVAVVTVPAHQRLFSEHDKALGHVRRYSRSALRRELEENGWTVHQLGGFFVLPLVARAGQKLVTAAQRASGRATRPPRDLGEWQSGRMKTALTVGLLKTDAALSRACDRIGVRTFGLSWWAVATPRSA